MIAPEPDAPASTPERLVLFTDAVAAIALTLLILPLLELIPEAAEKSTIGDLLRDHRGEFGAFVLSFAVIFRFWWAHHRVFGHLSRIRPALVSLSALWTFGIVFLPIPTEVITAFPPSSGSVVLYGGALVLASGSMTMLALYAHRHPELSAGRVPVTRDAVLANAAVFASQLLATVVGAVFAETVNYWAFPAALPHRPDRARRQEALAAGPVTTAGDCTAGDCTAGCCRRPCPNMVWDARPTGWA